MKFIMKLIAITFFFFFSDKISMTEVICGFNSKEVLSFAE